MANTNLQLALFNSITEPETYHDTSMYGYIALLVDKNGTKKQTCHKLTDMHTVLSAVDPNQDTWVSQAEFYKPNRRVVNLARLSLLFADLDTYKVQWAGGRSPEKITEFVLFHCNEEGIPPPSILIFSGRGFQAKWLLSKPLPSQALPRWNACQTYLVKLLSHIGADPFAKDASRVLRVVNTVNSKSGEICRVMHVTNGSDGQPVRYDFEDLSEALLPVSRCELEKQRHKSSGSCQLISEGNPSNLRKLSGRQLAWDRLNDLRQLVKMRNGVAVGERMQHLFWNLNFLLLSGATNSALMYHEARALAKEIDSTWNYNSKELMTLYSKAKKFEANEKVEFCGRKYSALYTPKNDTLINLFQITDNEQRLLKTIISNDIAKERDRERQESRRRAAGAIDRETYEANSISKQKPWLLCGMSRSTWYRLDKPEPNLNMRQVRPYY